MRKLKKVCNLDCFNCNFEDCILPDYYVSNKKLMDFQSDGSCVQEKSVEKVPKKKKEA